MTEAIVIDGSQGEGGGQILRSSLALALVTGQSVQIEGIRAGRDKPGLMRQHLTAVRAAVEIGQAEVDGDEIGSQSIRFKPQAIQPGGAARGQDPVYGFQVLFQGKRKRKQLIDRSM